MPKQLSLIVDVDLKDRAMAKAKALKPKKSLSDVIRILLEAWLSGEIDSRIFKKID